jgi:large subunit ribosomal protein L2
MSLKIYKSYTSSVRQRVDVDKGHLWPGSPMKSLTCRISATGGRNHNGHITARHRAAHHKVAYRKISFDRRFLHDIPASVVRLEYDPNRSGHIALVKYTSNSIEKFAYLLAPADVAPGDVLETSCLLSVKVDYKPGNCTLLGAMKDGTIVHNIEMKIGAGGILARSAGASAQLLGRDGDRVILRLTSGELRYVHKNCLATIGVVSNADHSNIVLGKAGRAVWRGWRPSVRGIAMNPVDHHNGGRANGGVIFASPKGLCAKGLKTRKNKRTSAAIINRRKK